MRLVKKLPTFVLAALLGVALVACGDGGDDDDDDDDDDDVVDPNGEHYNSVFTTLALPTTPTLQNEYAMNIDGDPQDRGDNALGGVLATLALQDVDLQTPIDENIASGDIILLADVQATSLTQAAGVGLQILRGENPDPAACGTASGACVEGACATAGEICVDDMCTPCSLHLEGGATFDIAPDSPADSVMAGNIIGGAFTGGPGTVQIQLSLDATAPPITLNLKGARSEVTVAADGTVSGKLGGAITKEDIDTQVVPGVANLAMNAIANDCDPEMEPCCPEGSTGGQFAMLFDADDNCEITLEEVQTNTIVTSVLQPDLDLFDADGNFNPRVDDGKDSLSLGVGYTTVTASFTP